VEKKNKKIFFIGMALLLCLQIIVLFYYGSRKAGFHEDELYSYYSSNKTAGLFVNDREWTTGESFRNELVVLPGEQFRYGVVKQMQSWDVHPPLYYYLLHTVCSLTSGIFSKSELGLNEPIIKTTNTSIMDRAIIIKNAFTRKLNIFALLITPTPYAFFFFELSSVKIKITKNITNETADALPKS